MSLYPNINQNNNNSKSQNQNILFPARVKDICLNNNQKIFSKVDGWVGLGTILFKPLYSTIDNGVDSFLVAKPLFSNIKQYPLKEELVLILNSPSYKLNNNPNSSDYYYFPLPIGLWNNINHNTMPDIDVFNSDPKDLNIGNTFVEAENIKSLLPEEGDIILEGRFGNSIRFSSTTNNKKTNNNSWSSNGNNGDPILIITNNHNNKIESNPWNPIQEDINNDGSSIYISSNQEILIDYASKNLKTLNINIATPFNSVLQIPDDNIF